MPSLFRIAIVFLLTIVFPATAQKSNFGIFIHDWDEKKFTQPVSVLFNDEIEKGPGIPINIDYSKKINKVTKYIFGINSTNYTGNYLEDPGLLNYLSLLKPGIIRFPGGDENILCFASSFSSGSIGVVIINKSNDPHKVQLNHSGFRAGKQMFCYELSKPAGSNEWSEKVDVKGQSNFQYIKGGPSANFTTIPAWTIAVKNEIS